MRDVTLDVSWPACAGLRGGPLWIYIQIQQHAVGGEPVEPFKYVHWGVRVYVRSLSIAHRSHPDIHQHHDERRLRCCHGPTGVPLLVPEQRVWARCRPARRASLLSAAA